MTVAFKKFSQTLRSVASAEIQNEEEQVVLLRRGGGMEAGLRGM